MSEFIITAVLTARVSVPQETEAALEAVMSRLPKDQLLARLYAAIASGSATGMVNWTSSRATARKTDLPLINLEPQP